MIRKILWLLATLLLAHVQVAEAQQPEKTPRIGFLSGGFPDVTPGIGPFRQELRELGYVEGKKRQQKATRIAEQEVTMKELFNSLYVNIAVLAAALFAISTAALAQTPSIEGTYRLISRTLRDGTVLKSPEVMGLQTYTKTHRNFNILSKDPSGQFTSRSIVATYTLTPTEYVETTLFHILVRGDKVQREVSTPPQRTVVTVEGGRIQFRTEQRTAVYDGNKFTATSPESVDVWERVD
jgi:hypothetical protein